MGLTAKSFDCPECGARRGHACKGFRIPGANTLGGGWGGPPDRKRPHEARYVVYREAKAEAETETELPKLMWGLKNAVPEDARAAWGARAIWKSGEIDLLWDRQSVVALTDEDKKIFLGSMNGGVLASARERARELFREGALRGDVSGLETLYEGPLATVVANTNASYGYLYIAAWRR